LAGAATMADAQSRRVSIFGAWRRSPELSRSLAGDPVGQNLVFRLSRRGGGRVRYDLSWTDDGVRSGYHVNATLDGRRYRRIGASGWFAIIRLSRRAFRDRWHDRGAHAGAEFCSLSQGSARLVCRGYEVAPSGRRFPYTDVFVAIPATPPASAPPLARNR
jgi:hypothetical protein